jgi:transcriptional regulator with XRE-family HTH domain
VTSATLIRTARRRAGLTQGEVAERLGKTQSEIGRWERGEARPSFETLQRIVRACDLQLTTHLARADDSYLPHIERMLALSPLERVERAAAHATALRRMQRNARMPSGA